MNKLFLYLVRLLSPLWSMLGADSRQLVLILKLKIELSNRQPLAVRSGSGKKEYNLPPWLRAFFRVLLPSLLGLTYIPVLLFVPDKELGLLFVTFAYFLFSILLLVMNFSSQLTDTSDNIILLPRPVHSRTMVLYRLLFTGYSFITAAVPLSFAIVITLMVRDGWASGLYYFLLTLPGLALVFAFVQMLLILLLRFVSGQKFKKLVYWLQALLIGWVYLSMQSSFYNKLKQTNFSFTLEYSGMLSWMPQYWIVKAWTHTAPLWMYVALSGMPLLCIFLIVRFLAPKFSARLTEIGSGFEAAAKTAAKEKTRPFRPKRFLLLQHPAARSGYLFTRKFTSRVTEYKMTVLPSFFYIVFTAVPVLTDLWKVISTGSGSIKQKNWLLPVYMLMYPITAALMNLKSSPQYKAAWVYETAPYQIKGQVRLGAGWAIFVGYYLPAFLIWGCLALIVTKGALWGNLLLAGINAAVLFLFQVLLLSKEMPASIAPEDQKAQKQQGFFRTILIMLLSVAIGAVHIFLLASFFWWALLLLAGIGLALCWLLWGKIATTA